MVQIWYVVSPQHQEVAELAGHEDQVYSLAWSQCGRFLSTSCKDGKIRSVVETYPCIAVTSDTVFRIYDPRASSAPVREGGNVIPKKGSRLVWTNDNLHLLVTGFTKQSERLVNLYTSQDLKQVNSASYVAQSAY